jgi:hypothetical protein
MSPFEVTYKVGKYQNTVIVQAEHRPDVYFKVRELKLIPEDAQIVAVETRE